MSDSRDIFERMRNGEPIRFQDPEYYKVQEVVDRALSLVVDLNSSRDVHQTRSPLSELIGSDVHESTLVFIPFHTNFGRFIRLGKNVFVNHACTFLVMGDWCRRNDPSWRDDRGEFS